MLNHENPRMKALLPSLKDHYRSLPSLPKPWNIVDITLANSLLKYREHKKRSPRKHNAEAQNTKEFENPSK
jgi:hypothetical protein